MEVALEHKTEEDEERKGIKSKKDEIIHRAWHEEQKTKKSCSQKC